MQTCKAAERRPATVQIGMCCGQRRAKRRAERLHDRRRDGDELPPNSCFDDPSKRNVGKLVTTLVSLSLPVIESRDPDLLSGVPQIARALLYPFIARVSLREVWFTDSEFRKLVESVKSLLSTLARYYDRRGNQEQTFVKYWTDLFLFKVSDDATGLAPPKPDGVHDPLFAGWLRHFCDRAVARRDVDFISSLQKGSRKAFPALGPHALVRAYRKHAALFSSDHGPLPGDLDESIRRVSGWVLSDYEKSDFTKFIPRGSACLELGRSAGGCLDLFDAFEFPTPAEEELFGRHQALQIRLEKYRRATHNRAVDVLESSVDRVFPYTLAMSAVGLYEPGKIRVITKMSGFLASALQPCQGALVECWKKRPESTMMHADCTPLVHRLHEETRGTELVYFASVDYAAATDNIKKASTFAALSSIAGKPYYDLAVWSFSTSTISYPRVLDDEGLTIAEPTTVLQVDGQPMGHALSFVLLCIANLGVYHCAVTRWVNGAEELTLRRRRELAAIMRRNVIVNGDDMLFKSTREFYQRFFIPCAADCGLLTSVGKQYLSHTFALINSQFFTVNWRRGVEVHNVRRHPPDSNGPLPYEHYATTPSGDRLSWPCRAPCGARDWCVDTAPLPNIRRNHQSCGQVKRHAYLNLNLVLGVCLKKQGADRATPTSVARDLNVMARMCRWSRNCLPEAMLRWRDDWADKSSNARLFLPNWYLPVHLGGCGLDRGFAPKDFRVTREQRFVASCFIDDPSLCLYLADAMDIPTWRYAKSLLKTTMIPSDRCHVASENEVRASRAPADRVGEWQAAGHPDWLSRLAADPWLAKICYAGRLRNGATEPLSETSLINAFLFKLRRTKNGRYARLTPASTSTIERYWTVRFFASFVAPAPPLHPLYHREPRVHLPGRLEQLAYQHQLEEWVDTGSASTSDQIEPVPPVFLNREKRLLLQKFLKEQDSLPRATWRQKILDMPLNTNRKAPAWANLPLWGGMVHSLRAVRSLLKSDVGEQTDMEEFLSFLGHHSPDPWRLLPLYTDRSLRRLPLVDAFSPRVYQSLDAFFLLTRNLDWAEESMRALDPSETKGIPEDVFAKHVSPDGNVWVYECVF